MSNETRKVIEPTVAWREFAALGEERDTLRARVAELEARWNDVPVSDIEVMAYDGDFEDLGTMAHYGGDHHAWQAARRKAKGAVLLWLRAQPPRADASQETP